MAKPFSLHLLLDLMEERTDEATRQLGKLIAAEQNENTRLEMLENYRHEYALRFQQASAQGITQVALRNYQAFISRIDEAIEHQRNALDQSKQNTEAGKMHWQQQNRQLKALNTLSNRHEQKEQQLENKRDQKIQDEFSNRRFALKED